MSPLSDKCKKSTSLQQFQDDLTEVSNVVHAVMIILCLYVQAMYVNYSALMLGLGMDEYLNIL